MTPCKVQVSNFCISITGEFFLFLKRTTSDRHEKPLFCNCSDKGESHEKQLFLENNKKEIVICFLPAVHICFFFLVNFLIVSVRPFMPENTQVFKSKETLFSQE